jgi:hypothetical protein
LAIIDSRHITLSSAESLGPGKRWPEPFTAELSKTSKLLMDFFQLQTLTTKLGPGGLRNCPLCGWPFVLINTPRLHGFGDKQPFKLGCLNPSCSNNKKPRRFDERFPFQSPPVCLIEPGTEYVIKKSGRKSVWVCPKHSAQCPSFRVIAGDCRSEEK